MKTKERNTYKMTKLYRKEYIMPLVILLIFLLMTFEPKGYYFISLAFCSLLLSYAGFIRRKNIIDKISIIAGLILFLLVCIYFFIK